MRRDAPTRVALVANALAVGGLERFIMDLGRGLVRQGHQVRLFLLTGGGPWLDEPGLAALAPALLGGRSGMRPGDWLPTLRCLTRLTRALRAFRPHVVQTHLFYSQVLGSLASRAVPGAMTVHVEQNTYPWKSRAVSALERLLAGARGRWVCPTEVVASDARRRLSLAESRVVVIPNAVSLPGSAGISRRGARERLGIPRDAFVIGTFERLVEQKNHGRMLEAMARVRAASPGTVRWVLAGGGPGRPALERAIANRGLGAECVLTGELEDPRWILPAIDVYATASVREGFGISVAEAAAAGSALVLPALPVFREVMGEHRAMYYPVNDAAGLAGALLAMRQDPGLGASLGRRARSWARLRYDLPRMVEAYGRLYGSPEDPERLSGDTAPPAEAAGNSFDFVNEVL